MRENIFLTHHNKKTFSKDGIQTLFSQLKALITSVTSEMIRCQDFKIKYLSTLTINDG